MPSSKEKTPLLSPILKWFMFAMILANIGGNMYGMLLPIYLTELGADITQVGLVFTVSSAAVLLMQLFGGYISDSIGRLRAIAIGSVGGVLAYIAMLAAPSWEWMMAAIAFSGFPRALVGPSFSAFIAENSTEENRGRVYGITDSIFQITGVLGPPIGGWMAGVYGFWVMLLLSGVLYTIASGLRVWMATTMDLQPKEDKEKVTLKGFKDKLSTMFAMVFGGGLLTWILLTDGISDISFRLSGELFPVYLEQIGGISLIQIGFMGSIFSGAMMVTPLISGKLADRYGERVPIAIGFLFTSIAMFVFLNSGGFPGFAAAWLVFGSGIGLLSPAYQSLISKVVPQNLLGTFTGLFRGSLGIISLPAPYVGSLLWAHYGPKTPFTLTAFAGVLVVLPILAKFKAPEKEPESTPALAD